jgi:hypothetical protein
MASDCVLKNDHGQLSYESNKEAKKLPLISADFDPSRLDFSSVSSQGKRIAPYRPFVHLMTI